MRTNASNHLQGFLSLWAAFCLLFVCLPGRRILVFAFLTFFPLYRFASPLFCLPSRAPPAVAFCIWGHAPHSSASHFSVSHSPLTLLPFRFLPLFRPSLFCLSFASTLSASVSPLTFLALLRHSLFCPVLFSLSFSPHFSVTHFQTRLCHALNYLSFNPHFFASFFRPSRYALPFDFQVHPSFLLLTLCLYHCLFLRSFFAPVYPLL